MKITAGGVAVVLGVVASVIAIVQVWPKLKAVVKEAAAKVDPTSRDNAVYQATGEWGLAVPDLFGGIFKSDAEKKVDEMMKPIPPKPTKKKMVTPTYDGSVYTGGH